MHCRTLIALAALLLPVVCPQPGEAARKPPAKATVKTPAKSPPEGKNPDAPARPASQKSRRAAFWACSDGKGSVSLFWLPTGGDWPEGGFRLERIVRGASSLLAEKLGPGLDATKLMLLPDAQAEEIRNFSDKLTQQKLTEDDRRASIIKMGGTATIDIPYGLALGVRYVDSAKVGGKRSYRLTLVGPDGQPEMTITSDEVDPSKRTPGPAQPVGLRGQPRIDSVALFWNDPPADTQTPVVGYRVSRSIGSGKGATTVSLTPQPLVLERYLRRGQPEFIDEDAPRLNLSYDVSGVDLFGRQSGPVRVSVLAKDFPELAPPPDVRVEGIRGGIVVSWTNTDNVYVGGFLVERSNFPNGPFQAAVQAPLHRDAAQYEDKGVEDGKEYYYRLRSVSRRGESGPPSPTYLARTATSGVAAGTNDGIEEETIVAASLDEEYAPAPPPVRRPTPPPPERAPAPEPVPAPRPVAPPPVAPPPVAPPPVAPPPVAPPPVAPPPVAPPPVAPEPPPAAQAPPRIPAPPAAAASAPDAVPQAAPASPAPDTPPQAPPQAVDPGVAEPPPDDSIPPPTILSILGTGGKVTISLAPGEPADRTEQFVVYRSSSAANMGVTVGRPLPGDTRKWQDTSAEPGNSYWYRIVSIGAKNRQSEPSRPKWVRVNR